jgi:uncharacterized protein YoxC
MLFADAYDAFSNGEITFLKFLTIAVMFLWIIYLSKEIFFPHKSDPRVDTLSAAVAAMTGSVTSTSAKMEHIEKRQNELIQQQREDTRLLFKELKQANDSIRDELKEYSESVQSVLREHEHALAKQSRPR